MATSLIKQLVTRATLAAFIGSQLTGCQSIQTSDNGLANVIQSAGQIAIASQGVSPSNTRAVNSMALALASFQAEQANRPATGASTVVRQTIAGPSPIGTPYARYANLSYSSSEFQNVYSRFKSTKAVLESNPRRYTQQQFYAFSGALADLMRYVDAIEARKEGLTDSGSWSDFYAESLASVQPEINGRIEMGSAAITAQISPDRMEAFYCPGCQGNPTTIPQKRVSSTAPTLNLPKVGGGTNSGRQTQPRSGQQSEDSIKASVMEDLKDLSYKEAFKQFTEGNSALLNGLKSQFTSRKAQSLVTSIPVVGNIINLGMLADFGAS